MSRAIVLILDGVGVGELPDASKYNDQGSNTVGNLSRAIGGLRLPFLENLGMGNIIEIEGVKKVDRPLASFGKMAEMSPGKDSTTGHWELMGVILDKPFPTYPEGFPDEIIKEFEKRIGYKTLGNYPASGTEIIKELGEEHINKKMPIVYTSADSVFQIACHINVFSLEELYHFCEIARALLQGEHGVARVIARPFAGEPPNFYRTKDRKDFSLKPPEPTLLDRAKENGFDVIAIGKVDDIFGQQGYTKSFHSVNNQECVNFVLNSLNEVDCGLIVANFVQFDMDWGHRNDIKNFALGLEQMDSSIEKITKTLENEDLLFITADHGNDPTTPSTDHSREYVPILAYQKGRDGKNIGTRKTFSDLAMTIARYLNINGVKNGEDFLDIIMQ
ncbi:MAG: phosphopentomutase [candidate division WOR-3 bacterium]|nr:phosphopentomutase [candidate division WOR-3 bacterium]